MYITKRELMRLVPPLYLSLLSAMLLEQFLDLHIVLIFYSVCTRPGRSMWLPGGSHGLGSLRVGPSPWIRVPGHLFLLSADLGHLPHCAPLQYSRATSGQGTISV